MGEDDEAEVHRSGFAQLRYATVFEPLAARRHRSYKWDDAAPAASIVSSERIARQSPIARRPAKLPRTWFRMIAVDEITKRFGAVAAVDRVSFTVAPGEILGLLGPNGAGKTTTMRMLTGTLQPDGGQVTFDGRSIAADLREAKRRVGYLAEENPVYGDMLVSEFLAYAAKLRGLSPPRRRAAIGSAVAETNIGSVFYRPISELSKGFRQRVGLAAAILHDPDLLVLDEPTEGLDPNQRADIRRLIANLGRSRTVILSTHVLQEIEAMCTRVVVLSRGALAAEGTVAELRASRSARATYVIEVEGDGADTLLGTLPEVAIVSAEPHAGRWRIRLEAPHETELRPIIFELARDRGWILWELHRDSASLERLFHALTNDSVEADTAAAEPPLEIAQGVQ